MGADIVYAFFGVRYQIESDDELEQLETGEDPRLKAARKAKLQFCLARMTDGEPHFLLIGTKIGAFGVEGASAAELSEPELAGVVAAAKAKLREAGIEEEPKFLLQLAAQY
jgi:hypothetical protein